MDVISLDENLILELNHKPHNLSTGFKKAIRFFLLNLWKLSLRHKFNIDIDIRPLFFNLQNECYKRTQL